MSYMKINNKYKKLKSFSLIL